MAPNNSREDIIHHRKKEVARLRLRGLSQRDILEELEKAGVINPETGKPFALGTVSSGNRFDEKLMTFAARG